MELNSENFRKQIDEFGSFIIEDVIDKNFVAELKRDLVLAIETEKNNFNGSDFRDYAMVLICSLYGKNFTDLFDNDLLMLPFNAILGDGSIVYAYTSSSMPPQGTNFSNRIHVDCPRVIPQYITNMGATILLDDFTVENGATWYLPKSHNIIETPDSGYFYQNAGRVIAPAGSVWFFNARLWHAGGNNQTNDWRHALTINMCRPWMKQRIDIPRAMESIDSGNLSEKAKQKLGFYAQVPANTDEYYLPKELRKYRQSNE